MTAQPTTSEPRGAAARPLGTPSSPRRSVLDSLNADDRLMLGHYLQTLVEYTDHPVLHDAGAEAELFGSEAALGSPSATHFAEPPSAVAERSGGARIPTLTGAEECTLFLRYNYARMRVRAVQDGYAGKTLPARATRELLAWAYRALDTRSTIARLNMPLVMAMAKRTKLASVDYNELISEGNMALLRSVDKFDCSRGFKFSTYACRAILKSFSRVALRMSRYRGRFPTEFDPAIERSDYLEQKREAIEIDCVDELKDILLRNLADLSEVERTVIHERFALGRSDGRGTAPKTLAEVGVMIGVTKERVRQIQNKALKKIRTALEEKYLAA